MAVRLAIQILREPSGLLKTDWKLRWSSLTPHITTPSARIVTSFETLLHRNSRSRLTSQLPPPHELNTDYLHNATLFASRIFFLCEDSIALKIAAWIAICIVGRIATLSHLNSITTPSSLASQPPAKSNSISLRFASWVHHVSIATYVSSQLFCNSYHDSDSNCLATFST